MQHINVQGFLRKACRLIAEEMNENPPKNAFELSDLIAGMGATVCVTIDKEKLIVTNMTGLFDKFMNEGR